MTEKGRLVLETKRLVIQPLSCKELQNYIALNNVLETQLGLNLYPRTLPAELKEALEQVILPQLAQPGSNPLYATLWTVIDKAQKGWWRTSALKGRQMCRARWKLATAPIRIFRAGGI